MPAVMKYSELRAKTMEELVELFDLYEGHSMTPAFVREEIARRNAEQQTDTMLFLTKAVAVMTLVNLVLVAWTVLG